MNSNKQQRKTLKTIGRAKEKTIKTQETQGKHNVRAKRKLKNNYNRFFLVLGFCLEPPEIKKL